MKQLSQEESNQYWKKLKSLDEPTSKQIANKEQLDAIMNELYKTSKTYNHNKKVIEITSKKPSLITRIFNTITKFIKFCLKCLIYFIVGYIALIVLLLILKNL